MQEKSPREPTYSEYKQAVWDYLLEHSDVTDGGSLFVKFHTDSRHSFENHIKSRAVYGYHRYDTRLKMNTRQKEALHIERSYNRITRKKIRHEKWKASREEMRCVLAEIKKKNERSIVLNKFPKLTRPVINMILNVYATARTKMIQYTRVVLSHLRNDSLAVERKTRKG